MATGHDREDQVRAERARAVGLFRYSLIREAADARLSTKQRGRLVRALAEREHVGPFGAPVRVSRETIDRWIRDWRRGGFDALVPNPRRVSPRTPAEVLDLAAALKREVPERTAVQVAAILRTHSGWAPDERTLQRHFARLELTTRPDGQPPQAFGRFEAEAPNVRWTGDALHGPTVRGRKALLMAFLDDHSRLVTGYRWARREDTLRLEAALRAGIAARGVPASLYLDNGAAMVDKQLLRACASLGIRLVHSRPGQPAGRGKIERFLCATRRSFASPVQPGGIGGRSLGLLAYLDPKGEGDRSLPGNQRPGPDVRDGALRDPRDMAKAGLPEAQSPEGESSHPPERHLKPAPALRRPGTTPTQPPGRERCPTRALKEMSGAPKSRCTV
ncbi:MAG TPA: DDE-type integrase/transposase/recombinase [Nakamurella sp.]|nr:DDE-type integrase/transposase/recombinase [Nakamurella sp.]